jgi:uncharacterized membrane protein YqiK
MSQHNSIIINPPSKLMGIVSAILILLVIIGIAILTTITNIDADSLGVVKQKFGGSKLAPGKIIAANGENGYQAKVLSPGLHFFYWPWQYDIDKASVTEISTGYLGLVQAIDGLPLPKGTIYAPEWIAPDKMIQAEYFLTTGKGFKGPQLSILQPGKYRLNPKLFRIQTVPLLNVKAGQVAVIKSNVGEIVKTENQLVPNGNRGIWDTAFPPGQFYLNSSAYEATYIDTRQVKVSYTKAQEAGERSKNQPQIPITVRSVDGFTFPVDVRITYNIREEDAPQLVANVGDDDMILDKLVTPTVRAIFRNNAEQVKALDYVQNRSKQEKQSQEMLVSELAKYGVTVLEVRIGDVGDETTLGALLKTQTDREIAIQEQITLEEQQRAAEKNKALEKTLQEAVEERVLATAAYGVQVADQNKLKLITEASATAEQITLIATAQAEAYKKVSDVIGANNAALLELMKTISENNIRITPDVMVSGGGANSGTTDALMGTMLKGMINKDDSVTK